MLRLVSLLKVILKKTEIIERLASECERLESISLGK